MCRCQKKTLYSIARFFLAGASIATLIQGRYRARRPTGCQDGEVTPISPSMPIYAVFTWPGTEEGGRAITATGDKRYVRATPRSIYVNTSGDLAYTS